MRKLARGKLVLLVTSFAGLACSSRVQLAAKDLQAPAALAPRTPLVAAITYELGGCTEFERVEARRSAGRIDLTLWGRRDDGPGVMCPAVIYTRTVEYRTAVPPAPPFTLAVRQPDGTELTRQVAAP